MTKLAEPINHDKPVRVVVCLHETVVHTAHDSQVFHPDEILVEVRMLFGGTYGQFMVNIHDLVKKAGYM